MSQGDRGRVIPVALFAALVRDLSSRATWAAEGTGSEALTAAADIASDLEPIAQKLERAHELPVEEVEALLLAGTAIVARGLLPGWPD